MTIQPLYDKVLLRRKKAAATTSSGLHVPQAAQEKSQFATVVAVGPGRLLDDYTRVPLTVEPGMTVLLDKWQGDEIEVDGEMMIIIAEKEVLGILGE